MAEGRAKVVMKMWIRFKQSFAKQVEAEVRKKCEVWFKTLVGIKKEGESDAGGWKTSKLNENSCREKNWGGAGRRGGDVDTSEIGGRGISIGLSLFAFHRQAGEDQHWVKGRREWAMTRTGGKNGEIECSGAGTCRNGKRDRIGDEGGVREKEDKGNSRLRRDVGWDWNWSRGKEVDGRSAKSGNSSKDGGQELQRESYEERWWGTEGGRLGEDEEGARRG
ncbi:hypothetical protein Tco_1275710 [Tanacetum coccineum]